MVLTLAYPINMFLSRFEELPTYGNGWEQGDVPVFAGQGRDAVRAAVLRRVLVPCQDSKHRRP